MLLHIFVYSLLRGRGARIFNGNKTDVKTEYTQAGCGHEYVKSFGALCSKGERCE